MIKKQTTKAKSKKGNVGKAVAIGAGIAFLSAAAYALMGPNGEKNRKKVKVWATKMKKEVANKYEDLKEISEPIYNKVIEDASKKYAKAKGISEKEVREVATDLKKHWKVLVTEARKKSASKKKMVQKAVKKATAKVKSKVKKVARKVAKKISK